MIQATSLVNGQLDHFFGTRSEADLTEDDAISTTNYKFNGTPNLIQFDAEVTQNFSGNSLSFADKSEQEMFGANVVVLEALGFLLSEAQNFARTLGKLIKPISIVHLFVTPLSMAEDGTGPSVSFRSTRYFIIQHPFCSVKEYNLSLPSVDIRSRHSYRETIDLLTTIYVLYVARRSGDQFFKCNKHSKR